MVTSLSNDFNYQYGANRNTDQRNLGSEVFNLAYDAENHLVQVSGTVTATYGFDGDGKRVLATQGITTTVYIGNYFEMSVSNGVTNTVSYYYAGSELVAMRKDGGTPTWLLGDHLGSTSLVYNGSEAIRQGYKAWGEMRFIQGADELPTKFRYTGQREEASIGLYYYGARWYDTSLSRWTQTDDIIPESSQGFQAWDRYAYSNNNPLRYSDPTGHSIWDIIGQFATGFVLEFALNMPWATSPTDDVLEANEAESTAELAGRVAGDVAAAIVGTGMVVEGSAGAFGGAAACGTGVLCGAGVVAVAVGATEVGVGAVTAVKAVGNLGENLSRIVGNSPDDPEPTQHFEESAKAWNVTDEERKSILTNGKRYTNDRGEWVIWDPKTKLTVIIEPASGKSVTIYDQIKPSKDWLPGWFDSEFWDHVE